MYKVGEFHDLAVVGKELPQHKINKLNTSTKFPLKPFLQFDRIPEFTNASRCEISNNTFHHDSLEKGE